MKTTSLPDWLATPLGRYVLQMEQAWLDEVVPDIFGYHAIQLGLPGVNLLRESRIAHKVVVSPQAGIAGEGQSVVAAQFHQLPFESQSVDLCLLPHVLEFSTWPHEVLREVDRILRPEGRALILGFNPWSLFGVKKLWATEGYPWQGNFVSLVRMKDWFQLLGFETSAGKLACYIPPCETSVWQQRWRFLEEKGERWWGVTGAVYMLNAIKRVQGMHLITPNWSVGKESERRYATAKREAKAAVHLKLVK